MATIQDMMLDLEARAATDPTAKETLDRILKAAMPESKKMAEKAAKEAMGQIVAEGQTKMYERSLPAGADIESIPKKVGGGVGGRTYPVDRAGAIQQLIKEVVANPQRPLTPQQARIAAAVGLTGPGGNIGTTMYHTPIDVRQRTQTWPMRDKLDRIIYSGKIDPVTGKPIPEFTSKFGEAGEWGRKAPLSKATAPLAFGAKVPIADLQSEVGGLGRSPAKTRQAKELADQKMWRQSMKGDPVAIERMMSGEPMWTRTGQPRASDIAATYPTTPTTPGAKAQQGFLVKDYTGTSMAAKPGRSLAQILTAAGTSGEAVAGGAEYKKMLPQVQKMLKKMGLPGGMLALLAALGAGTYAGTQQGA